MRAKPRENKILCKRQPRRVTSWVKKREYQTVGRNIGVVCRVRIAFQEVVEKMGIRKTIDTPLSVPEIESDRGMVGSGCGDERFDGRMGADIHVGKMW